MAVLPLIDLFKHEALPDWRTRAFWFGTRPTLAMPALMIGVVSCLYVLILTKLAAALLFYAWPGDGARSLALVLEDEIPNGWLIAKETALYAACVFIGENAARAALDIAALKPFSDINAKRFMRAAAGAGAAVGFQFCARLAERALGLPEVGVGGAMAVFAVLTGAIFVSLSLAFAQGAELKKEQDLTV